MKSSALTWNASWRSAEYAGRAVERAQLAAVPARSGSDAAGLIQRARGGDREAFRGLYERHARMVHGVLLSMVPPQEADDLAQEVFLAAWRGLDTLREEERVGGWLGGIARNLGRRFHSRGVRAPKPLPSALSDPRPEAGDGSEVLAVLRRLPDAYRETLAMRLVEGMTGPEIAEATGMTHGSVRVNLSRGMKLLREELASEGWT
ncbi:MAG: sigma-70 family RNA polymerase sigma factor [Planctomycetota bacterium]|nr:MAG: sigma-70 family RNA polymerase sigma factor [Planctomycetota bacterium]